MMTHKTGLRRRWLATFAAFALLVCFAVPIQARQDDLFGLFDSDCPFPAPDGVTCAVLVVPEDRDNPDGNVINLAVAIIAARSDNPDPVPVIYLDGGPGSGPLLTTDGFLRHPLIQDHTLILYDQRGTGFSQPSLNCPELEGDAESDDPIADCRDRLESGGANLQMYSSAASAADVNDLVAALGYDKVNLWGISYGTKLGLTILRDYPEIVQSAVLDSVYAPEADDFEIASAGVLGSLNELFARCADDSVCSTAYPNLESDFYALLDQLDAEPVTVETDDGTIDLDGATLYEKLFQTLYDSAALPYLPYGIELLANAQYAEDYAAGYAIIADTSDLITTNTVYDDSTPVDETDMVQDYIAEYGQIDDSEGMAYSVDCQEEYLQDPVDDDLALADQVPAPLNGYITGDIRGNVDACQTWGVLPADPIETQRVESDVPTLLFAGAFDPITPISSAESALEGLPNGQLLIFPSAGHGITFTDTDAGDCAKSLMIAFLDDPGAELDQTCIDATSQIDFYTGD